MPNEEMGDIGAGATTPSSETFKPKEKKDSKEVILSAFEEAYQTFDSFPQDQLTHQQRFARELLREIKAQTIDSGKVSYINRFKGEDGRLFTQQEFLPVDELMTFLRDRIVSGGLSAEDEAKYREWESVIHRNCREYYTGSRKKQLERKLARITQESERIKKYPELIQEAEKAATDVGLDGAKGPMLMADRMLSARRELVLPAKDVEPPPPPPPVEQLRHEILIANRTQDPRKHASEISEEALQHEIRRGSAWNPLNWPRKIGMRVAEEHFRQRYIERTTAAMLEHNNSLLDYDPVRNALRDANSNIDKERAAGQATVKQIKSGELIAGQKIEEAENGLKKMLVDEVLRPAVEGTITDIGQLQEQLRQFVVNHQDNPQIQSVFGRDATDYGRLAEYFASDLLEMAEAIRQDVAIHKYSLEQIDEHVKIQLANTSWAAQTRAHFNAADRAVAWAERNRLRGWILNPATIGAAASLVTFVGLRASGRLGAAAQILVPGAGAIVGGVLAAIRRNYDLKVDMASHRVQRAYGEEIEPDSPRREALEQYAYDTATIGQLINGGGKELLGGGDRKSLHELLADPKANAEAIIKRVAEIKTRLDFSALQHVDLVTFESREDVEQNRLLLIDAVVAARKILQDAEVTTIGMPTPDGGSEDLDLATAEERFKTLWKNRFTTNQQKQDRRFLGYRIRNAGGAAVFAAGFGFAGGLLSQEAIAVGKRLVGNTNVGRTILENVAQGRFREIFSGGRAPGFASDTSRTLFDNPGKEQISQGVFLRSDGNHNFDFVDSNDQPISSGKITIDQSSGNIVVEDRFGDMPQNLRDSMAGPGWGQPVEVRSLGFGADLARAIYQNGGQQEIGPGVFLRGIINPDGTRQFSLLDSNNNVFPVNIDIDQNGQIITDQSLNRLPAGVRLAFEQQGFTIQRVDGLTHPLFNIDKTKDFFTDPNKYGGEFDVNSKVDLAIDPEFQDGDRAVRFLEKGTGTLLDRTIEGPPMWATPEGKLIIAGTPDNLPPEVKDVVGSYDTSFTTQHNLRFLLSELAKGGVEKTPDVSLAHGNFLVNSHDITESNLLNPQGKPYDVWASEAGRLDPVTGRVEVGKMSFTFKPENIMVHGFLNQDGRLHISDQFYGNEGINPQQWTKTIDAMRTEGWGIERVQNGYLVTPPDSYEYTPPEITRVIPPEPTWTTEFAPPAPQELDQEPIIPIPFSPRHPSEPIGRQEKPQDKPDETEAGRNASLMSQIRTQVDNLIDRVRNLPVPALPKRDAIASQLQGLKTDIGNLSNNIPLLASRAQSRLNSIVQSIPPIPTPNLEPLSASLDKLSSEIRNLVKNAAQKTEAQKAAQEQKKLHDGLLLAKNRFEIARQNGIAKLSPEYATAGKFLWQEVIYGPERKRNGDNCYKGYLMIEPEDMPEALQILAGIGSYRQAAGKSLDFKWLLNTYDRSAAFDPRVVGTYKLAPTDPRIALYADTPEEILEILSALAANPRWQALEQKRVDKMGGTPAYAPRRPGTNAYIDASGKEWRSLNYNNKPGYSEDEARDPNWRNAKQGANTQFIP